MQIEDMFNPKPIGKGSHLAKCIFSPPPMISIKHSLNRSWMYLKYLTLMKLVCGLFRQGAGGADKRQNTIAPAYWFTLIGVFLLKGIICHY